LRTTTPAFEPTNKTVAATGDKAKVRWSLACWLRRFSTSAGTLICVWIAVSSNHNPSFDRRFQDVAFVWYHVDSGFRFQLASSGSVAYLFYKAQ
jgi:hypothetical protein